MKAGTTSEEETRAGSSRTAGATADGAACSAETESLEARARAVRRRTLALIGEAGYGFLGPCCSCTDLLVCLGWSRHTRCFEPEGSDGRANLVLSKGHAVAALYAALMEHEGVADPGRYAAFGSPLQAHPNSRLFPRVIVSSGSLGQGVAVSVGLALAERLSGRRNATYVVVGDGELQAGVVWESLVAAASQTPPPRLTVVVDANGSQSTGRVRRPNLARAMLQAVASEFVEVDGHDIPAILGALETLAGREGVCAVWARTRRGAGLEGFDEEWPMSKLPEPELVSAWLRSLGG